MKRNDIKALHDKSAAELTKQLEQHRLELAKMRLERKVAKLANPRQVSALADDIARIQTVLGEKKVAEQAAVSA
jgi:ribosomal protein L29